MARFFWQGKTGELSLQLGHGDRLAGRAAIPLELDLGAASEVEAGLEGALDRGIQPAQGQTEQAEGTAQGGTPPGQAAMEVDAKAGSGVGQGLRHQATGAGSLLAGKK